MSIMGCYPDSRAIENELGGKWEKLYQYTFDTSHIETFEFPTDLDGTPLHLNGVLVDIYYPAGTVMNNHSVVFRVNGVQMLYQGVTSSATISYGSRMYYKALLKNGLVTDEITGFTNVITEANKQGSNQLLFTDDISSFAVHLTGGNPYPKDVVITFYVLRGV